MNAGAKLGAYGVLLAAALGGGAALGAVVGPIDVGGAPAHDTHDSTEEDNRNVPTPSEPAPAPGGGYHP